MARCRRHTVIRTAVAAALLTVPSAVSSAAQPTQNELLWLPLSSLLEDTVAAFDDVPALLSLPSGWATGDAAAVLIGNRHRLDPRQERLVEALLDEGTAVLELDMQALHDPSGRSAASSEPPILMHLLLRGLSAAILALHQDAGAGLVVAIGSGAGGEAALLAAQEAEMARHLSPGGPRLAASAALGPGRPAFTLGAAPAAEQEWSVRAPLLCTALSAAARTEAPPSGPPVAPSERAEMERDCLAALLPRLSPNTSTWWGKAR